MIVHKIRKSFLTRPLVVALLVCNVMELCFPSISYALTTGPSQPEVQSFEPVSMNQNVNPQTGDFTYSLDLGIPDYPVNLAYHSGVTMDQEATNTGLGWNLSIGVLNRQMRGLPDDYSGEEKVVKEMNMRPNWTVGLGVEVSGIEIAGFNIKKLINLGASLGIMYNNYKGVGFRQGFNVGLKNYATLGLGSNSYSGIDVSPQLSMSFSSKNGDYGLSIGVGGSYSSRYGLKSIQVNVTPRAKRTSTSPISGSAYNFNDNTVLPVVQMPMSNISADFRASVGVEINTVNPNFGLNADYSRQAVAKNIDESPAYGYLYAHKVEDRKSALQDFTRAMDGRPFLKKKGDNPQTQYMAFANQTYDLYNASGQGTGGAYRLVRGEAGSVNDKDVSSSSLNPFSLGIEVGLTQLVKVGVDFKATLGDARTGLWDAENAVVKSKALNFKSKKEVGDPFYEPAYFKASGELTAMDEQYLNSIGGEEPVRVELGRSGAVIKTTGRLKTKNGFINLKRSDTHKKRRDKRNQVITYLTSEEYYNCMDKLLYSYDLNSTYGTDGKIPRDSFPRTDNPKQHISEMTVLQTDGSRYVYGMPAYNRVQKDAIFNVDQDQNGLETGKSTYQTGDNSIDNQRGLDHFFSRTTMPGFSHSFMLTQVLSSDYVDVNEDGPTDDDLGNWVKFNYTKVYDDYKWRAPFEANSVNYSEGQRSNPRDQKGTYVYGEKEIHYIHSIESRSYITEFKYSDRNDSYGVAGENGGIDQTKPLKKVDKIFVYSREDRIRNGDQAVPVKVVHFEYDYSLCKKLPNNKRTGINNAESGKLTLKKVYFTYGRDLNGNLNPYEFEYGFNPDYSYRDYDRWGSYKQADPSITNFDFPYALQNKSTADNNAAAWHLNKVKLPSGGTMTVNYESDDYAYVQNKRAGKMVKVLGFAGNSTDSPGPWLMDGKDPNQYLFFEPTTAATQKSDIEPYVRDMKYMYFKCLVRLGKSDNANDSYYEYITGYAEVENDMYGVTASGKGWIKLKNRPLKDKTGPMARYAHPIAKTAWQFTRLQYPQIAYEGSDNPDNDIKKTIMAMVSFVPEVIRMFRGFNADMLAKKKGIKVDLSKSFVRLYDEDGFKYGGGSRVKSIVLNNKWGSMVPGEFNDEFGSSYDYTTINERKERISSGVATYEPIIGGDENSMKEPVLYRENNAGAPDNDYMVELPFGESLYPGASVGYSKVTVRSLKKGGGVVENEFYTAKDFPSITRTTDLDIQGPPPGAGLLRMFGYYYGTDAASQGYTIELNDMHGKPKATRNYSDNDNKTPISGVEYKYYTEAYGTGLRLNNNIKAINKKGEVVNREIAKEVDFITDFQQNENTTKTLGFEFNSDMFFIAIIGIAIPTVFPDLNFEFVKFNSAVSTKVIQKSGILKETIVLENGTKVSTENLAFDEETGQALLTRTKNDFDNPIFNLTIPSHFAYDGMGPAYQNIGIEFDSVIINDGVISGLPTAVNNYFAPGDEVGCKYTNGKPIMGFGGIGQITGGNKLWVLPNYTFINQDGSLYDSKGRYVSLKVLRSGRRNMQSIPIATYTSFDNPITTVTGVPGISGHINSIGTNTKILAASASEFSDKWFTNCDKTLVSYDSCLIKSKIELLNDLNWLTGNDKMVPLRGYLAHAEELLNGDFERSTPSPVQSAMNSSCSSVPCSPANSVVQDLFQALDFKTEHQVRTHYGSENAVSFTNISGGGTCTIYDHTKGDATGRMLQVDGNTTTSGYTTSWMPYKALDVIPGAPYMFSFWVNAGCYPVPGAILPQINSKAEGPFGGGMTSQLFDTIIYRDTLRAGDVVTIPDSGRWHQVQCFYTIPSNVTSLYPTIDSRNASGTGNDFILDDIEFYPLLRCRWENALLDSNTFLIRKPLTQKLSYGPVDTRYQCASCNILLMKDSTQDWSFTDIDTVLDLLPIPATSQTNDFRLIVKLNDNSIDTIDAQSDCICTNESKIIQTCENKFNGAIINPYKHGLLGNWRKTRDWLYDNDRSYLYASTAGGSSPTYKSDIRTDGIFKTFTPFWKYSSGHSRFITDPAGWTWTNLVTKYNENGQEIENKDALGRYSAALFGFNHTIALAVASNAKYNQIAYDGAEEYTYYDALPLCKSDHYSFLEGLEAPNGITDKEHHTGKYSIEVKADGEVTNLRDSVFGCTNPDTSDYMPAPGQPFTMKNCMCKGKFFPDEGRYYFSAWVKERTGCDVFTYNTATVEIQLTHTGGTESIIIHPKGKVIEGWQKMDTVFNVPQGLIAIQTRLIAGANDAYFDDIRIQPFNSSMKSFAYDAITLNLLGELDANNYATIYEYDPSKKLIRIKKETEDGVLMIKEFREKQSRLRP